MAGALVVPLHLTNTVRELLSALGWLKLGRHVSSYTESNAGGNPMRAIHVSPKGFKALTEANLHSAEAAVPEELGQMLRVGDVKWVPGLRVGAFKGARQKEKTVQPRKVGGNDRRPSHFTYVELFAGIGGFRLGLDALDGQCVLTCELSPEARATYSANFGGLEGDEVKLGPCCVLGFRPLKMFS